MGGGVLGDARAQPEHDRPGPVSQAARAGDPLAGTAYRSLAKLGEGSMGLVVEAQHVALGTTVVVKLLHAELVKEPDIVDRLRLEAQSLGHLSRLGCPHLTNVTDFAVTPAGIPFLVMERLHGVTVRDHLKKHGAFPVDQAIEITRQTLSALSVVHGAGIIHRDIKPANLFLCAGPAGRPMVKLLDFGIAKVLSSAPKGSGPMPLRFPTAEGTTLGTPRCLSPEQARGLPVDERTDIYSVGVLLYALLVGQGPFDHIRGTIEVITAHAKDAPAPPSTRAPHPIPAELEAIVMKALAKRPADRFASAAEFSAALDRVSAAATQIPAAPPEARAPDSRPSARAEATFYMPSIAPNRAALSPSMDDRSPRAGGRAPALAVRRAAAEDPAAQTILRSARRNQPTSAVVIVVAVAALAVLGGGALAMRVLSAPVLPVPALEVEPAR